MTRVAFGAKSLEDMHTWFPRRGDTARLTTRYLPKRHVELVGGSLFWIFKHTLVARSQILGFEPAEAGKTNIVITTVLVNVRPTPRRAHQGWRYLAHDDAPDDLGELDGGDALPIALVGELAKLGLV